MNEWRDGLVLIWEIFCGIFNFYQWNVRWENQTVKWRELEGETKELIKGFPRRKSKMDLWLAENIFYHQYNILIR